MAPTDEPRPTLARRLAASAGLSVFFLVVYGGTGAVAGLRSHVPSFHFGWEHRVPFVAAMIVPYLSEDLFFIIAPLLARSRRELRTLAVRVVVAITVAAVCFVAMPLRFAFDRPTTTGPFGWACGWFFQVDSPLNQLPSLHVALLLIVGTPFVRTFKGITRIGLLVWFALMAASPLLVHQHHVTDLLAGLALGLLCLTLIGDEPRTPFGRNGRVGGYYLAGGVALLVGCLVLGRPGWPLWWPTVSVLTVAAGYLLIGPTMYGKRNGTVGLPARLLFWPTLLGQRASRLWYARQSRPWDAVTDHLWIGRQLRPREAAAARAAGVGAVVDLTCEFTEPVALRSLPYLHLPTLDLTAPTGEQLDQAVAFAAAQAAAGGSFTSTARLATRGLLLWPPPYCWPRVGRRRPRTRSRFSSVPGQRWSYAPRPAGDRRVRPPR